MEEFKIYTEEELNKLEFNEENFNLLKKLISELQRRLFICEELRKKPLSDDEINKI